MENLHLKNLQTNKIIDYYISEIEKINKRNNNFTTLQTACKIINNDTEDITDEILIKLEQINNDRINIHKTIYYGKNLTECLINYSTKKRSLV